MIHHAIFKKTSFQLIAALCIVVSRAAVADVFSDYVQECKDGLGINSIPQFDCRDVNFRVPDGSSEFARSNDFVAHRSINDVVEAVFACRWVRSRTGDSHAASGEMLVHNRSNGKTCFFALDPINKTVVVDTVLASNEPVVGTTNPPSPTDSDASSFWASPTSVKFTGCTRCHSSGPYIASPQIVHALEKFGLINDGHDTWASNYKAVGTTFGQHFNDLITGTLQPGSSALTQCSSQCHVVGGNPSQIGDSSAGAQIIIPSINLVIDDDLGGGHMPPNDPESDYRWINRDDPGYSGDHEDLAAIAREYPPFACSNPNYIEAHVVDSDEIITTNLPDKFNRFNLQDGLVCLSSEQSGGHRCRDYQTRYMCNGRFTAFQNNDDPSGSGDWEPRNTFFSKYSGSCANPTWIQARFMDRGKWVYINGPADRLAEFDTGGLVCLNSQQDNGKCSNYVVRFNCQ